MTTIEERVRKRVAAAIAEIQAIEDAAHYDNPLIFGDERRAQMDLISEIKHLLWVLDESVPAAVFDIMNSPITRK